MNSAANSGVTFNPSDNETEKLIKILANHPKLDVDTPTTRTSDEVDDRSELINKIEKLEANLISTCKMTRSFIKRAGKNFEKIHEIINAERRNTENSFSLLSERISNNQRLIMDKIVELNGVVRTTSSNTNEKNDDNLDNSNSDSINDDDDSPQ
uniref:Biogenesis of lysosome-related organelles complex 1 subunit KXD1 n=1 Tax=Strongyloides venezuelensis TaxID=75913 RepID=A0A0K0F7H9_STRVS